MRPLGRECGRPPTLWLVVCHARLLPESEVVGVTIPIGWKLGCSLRHSVPLNSNWRESRISQTGPNSHVWRGRRWIGQKGRFWRAGALHKHWIIPRLPFCALVSAAACHCALWTFLCEATMSSWCRAAAWATGQIHIDKCPFSLTKAWWLFNVINILGSWRYQSFNANQ